MAGTFPTRRAVLAASLAPPAMLLPAGANASDQQFAAWEAELDRLEALPLPDDDDLAQAEIDACGRLSNLIIETRSVSPTAAKAKLRQMAGSADPHWAPVIEDVLACLDGR